MVRETTISFRKYKPQQSNRSSTQSVFYPGMLVAYHVFRRPNYKMHVNHLQPGATRVSTYCRSVYLSRRNATRRLCVLMALHCSPIHRLNDMRIIRRVRYRSKVYGRRITAADVKSPPIRTLMSPSIHRSTYSWLAVQRHSALTFSSSSSSGDGMLLIIQSGASVLDPL